VMGLIVRLRSWLCLIERNDLLSNAELTWRGISMA
jgi:hypothetical protein